MSAGHMRLSLTFSSFFSCSHLSNNALTGTIPPQISTLTKLMELYAPKWHIHWVLVIRFIECWSCAPLSQPFKCLLHAHLESCCKVGLIQSRYTTQVPQWHTNWAKDLPCRCKVSCSRSEAHQKLYLRELISTLCLPSALRLCYEAILLTSVWKSKLLALLYR